jgi:hypothetical protein
MQYNFAALNMIVTPEMIREYKKQVLSPAAQQRAVVFHGIYIGVIVAIGLAVLWGVINTIVTADSTYLVPSLLGLLAAVLTLTSIIILVRTVSRNTWNSIIRINTFCKDNGFECINSLGSPNYPGMMFTIGHSKLATNVVRGVVESNPFEFGAYNYSTGSGKYQRNYSLGYVQIQLDRKLPHMVLDAVKNNHHFFGMQATNLPVAYKKEQAMKLEGNFNDYFQLYAPVGYERDALYVFAPDLMALLIDEVSVFDAEIVDDQLYIYTPVAIQYHDIPYMQRLMRIIEIVGKKMDDQTDRYQDERAVAQPGTVAIEGRRLKSGATFLSIVITIVIVVYFGVQLIAAFN